MNFRQTGDGRFYLISITAAALVYFLTAFYSIGYHHPDEHYQLIEFALFKMGLVGKADLAWEYDAGIRSSLQPSIAYLLFKTIGLAGITSAPTLAFLLRMVTALFALTVINQFIRRHLYLIHKGFQQAFIILSLFFWVLPYWNVRFSSETWAGLTLMWALSLQQDDRKGYYLRLGLVLGVSFLFRFQMAIIAGSLLTWLYLVRKERIPNLLTVVAGMLLAFAGGILLDHWFYGKWLITAYHYFQENIMHDVASNYGTAPWYYYLMVVLKYLIYPVGVLLTLLLMYFLLRKPLDKFVWILFPFLVVHSAIPHKEVRFLVPLINLLPIMTILSLQVITARGGLKVPISLQRIVVVLAAAFNMAGLISIMFTPAGSGRLAIITYINEHYSGRKLHFIHSKYSDPFTPWDGLTANFYLKNAYTSQEVSSLCGIDSSMVLPGATNLVIVKRSELYNADCLGYLAKELKFLHMKESRSLWSQYLLHFYYGGEDLETFVLFSQEHPVY